ncbi:hypothetical protein ACOME3_007267 [Neoechinorhynchus agilis]
MMLNLQRVGIVIISLSFIGPTCSSNIQNNATDRLFKKYAVDRSTLFTISSFKCMMSDLKHKICCHDHADDHDHSHVHHEHCHRHGHTHQHDVSDANNERERNCGAVEKANHTARSDSRGIPESAQAALKRTIGLGLPPNQFEKACSSILEIMTNDTNVHTQQSTLDLKRPSQQTAILYGSLATFLVCLSSAPGMLMFRFLSKGLRNQAMAVLTSLSVGTLAGDALFHLIPHAYGLHSHGDDSSHECDHEHGGDHLAKTLMVIVGMYSSGFFGIATVPLPQSTTQSDPVDQELVNNSEKTNRKVEQSFWKRTGKFLGSIRYVKRFAYIILFADSIHNACDGVALAAAFSSSTDFGFITTLVVLLHELPHELGDYAILIHAGFTNWQALFFNLATALTAYIGLIVGFCITSMITSSLPWVLAYTAGVFLYVALVDLFPLLLPNKRISNIRVVLFNVGLIAGCASMYFLAKYEGNTPHAH